MDVADEGDESGGDDEADARDGHERATAGVWVASAASWVSIILMRRSRSRISVQISARAGRRGSGMLALGVLELEPRRWGRRAGRRAGSRSRTRGAARAGC